MKYQDNFQRTEKKYLINEEQYRSLMSLIYLKLEYGKYHRYKICNIYFDTPEYDLIRQSIEKPIYKEKLRLRSYGLPDENDMVFMEIKKKFDGVVYKRRALLTYRQALDYLFERKDIGINQPVFKEVDWLMTRYNLYPVLYLSYDRLAMKGIEDKDLRLTFDSNLRWRAHQLDMRQGDFGETKLTANQYIMEIKAEGAMPLWLVGALNQLEIYPQSYSKYGIIYKENLIKESLGGK